MVYTYLLISNDIKLVVEINIFQCKVIDVNQALKNYFTSIHPKYFAFFLVQNVVEAGVTSNTSELFINIPTN